ncbi:MAG: FkbM family methyltransferase [Chlamydiae bacterium]|nr:FkbM family methyltransferase [Chlamydiota bacterium]
MIKTLLKKVLPKPLIAKLKSLRHAARNANISPEERRSFLIGLDRKQFRDFMLDPDAALKTKQLHLFGAMKKTSFLKESKAFIVESVFEDAYQLEKIPISKDKNCKILDVGANVGIFAMAARGHFPNSTIHCYEPHPSLEQHLKWQAYAVSAKYYTEAVGVEDGYFSSDEMQNEILQSQSVKIMDFTKPGNIKVAALKTAIERIGGYVDILKLDCEGSEWVILKDRESLKKVEFLTTEFHRFSPDGSFDIYDRSIDLHEKARKFVLEAGFKILFERYHTVDAGIILAQRVK